MKYLAILFTALLFTSCIKDKLENETLILEGNWNWSHSVEYTYDSTNDTILTNIISASNYSETYGLKIEKKGRVYTMKNGSEENKYRLVLPTFKLGLCNLSGESYEYEILLNNKDDEKFNGCVNSDTLVTSDIHLPLSKGATDYPYYKHFFVK